MYLRQIIRSKLALQGCIIWEGVLYLPSILDHTRTDDTADLSRWQSNTFPCRRKQLTKVMPGRRQTEPSRHLLLRLQCSGRIFRFGVSRLLYEPPS